MSPENNNHDISLAQNAIASYLDDLLREVPEDNTTLEVTVEEKKEDLLKLTTSALLQQATPDVVAKSQSITETETQNVEEPEDDEQWRQQPFQALLFKIGGLSLAVPLIKLYGVIPWTDKIAKVPNRTDWYLGLLHHRDQNVRVIDTHNMVMNKPAQQPPEYRHILLVDHGRWGLTCEHLGEVINLEPEQVKWRTAKGKRPWLAGTVLEHLCALIDADAFARMLDNENHKK